jgi:hypothetical protein
MILDEDKKSAGIGQKAQKESRPENPDGLFKTNKKVIIYCV